MNNEERKSLGKLWLALAQTYGKDISSQALTMLLDSVDDLDFFKTFRALENWIKTSKINRPPLPAEIRESANAELSTDARANESAAKIRPAIIKYGWNQPEDAREYIGELGWMVVERTGGWEYICQNHGDTLSPLTYHAQARDIAKALIESSNLGVLDKPIGLTAPKNENLLLDTGILKKVNLKPKTIE